MKLTIQFECERSIDRDTERSISTRGRDADDLDMVIDCWKTAYEDATDAPVRAVLTEPAPESTVDPEDIAAIDAIEDDADADAPAP